MMSWSSSSPATRRERETTTPPMEMTATSVVPPPMSTIILPRTSATGSPAPRAAARGSSIRYASRAPADMAASYTARFSTSVAPEGIPTTTRGLGMGTIVCWCAFPIKYPSIAWVISNSDITPSRKGRIATTFAGVLPTISFACAPIANGRRLRLSIATQEGSFRTIPFPRTFTSVFAVPRSMPISREKSPSNQFNGLNANRYSL